MAVELANCSWGTKRGKETQGSTRIMNDVKTEGVKLLMVQQAD